MERFKDCKLQENTTHRMLHLKINKEESDFEQVSINLKDFKNMQTLLTALCEEMHVKYTRDCLLYNLTGLCITEDDIHFIQDGD